MTQSDRSGVSFAHANRTNLPGEPTTLDSLQLSPSHSNAVQNKQSGRASDMVRKDKPHPAPRPSPALAHEVDSAVFNAAWRTEQIAAKAASRSARLEAFKAKRKAQSAHTINRSFNHTVRR